MESVLSKELLMWILGPVAGLAVAALLLAIKRVIFSKIRKLVRHTDLHLDDILVNSLRAPLGVVIIGLGLSTAMTIMPLPERWAQVGAVIFKGLVILAAFLFVNRLLKELIEVYGQRLDFVETSRGVFKGLIQGLLILLAALIFLDLLGISITPLLASLGIGSLAVALALQDTLGNLFAGIQTMVDKPVQVGDFIKLESGEEGYVTDIGWRSTRIRMLRNNVVVIPNSKLINSTIINYSLPEPVLSVRIEVGVHYDSDLEHVERVTLEVAREVMREVPGGLPDFEPYIRYHTFADSSINFTVFLSGQEFRYYRPLRHEFIKRLHKRYAQEGIVIPFPLRTLDIPPGLLREVGRTFGSGGPAGG